MVLPLPVLIIRSSQSRSDKDFDDAIICYNCNIDYLLTDGGFTCSFATFTFANDTTDTISTRV